MSGARRVGVYPGTFDPVTNGHTDIILRATTIVDELIVAIAGNAGKGPLFGADERAALVRDVVDEQGAAIASRVHIKIFDNLLMDFATDVKASCIIRGLRAVSDFEYEFQMAGMNARLNPNIETVFLMASERQQFISSRFVKEIARLGGDISTFVAPQVAERITENYRK